MSPSLSSCPCSPNLVEGGFSEVVPQGFLESSGSPATVMLSTPLRGAQEEGVRRPWCVGSLVAEFPLIAYLGRSSSAVRRARILHIFPVTLFVYEPGLVHLAIGHGGAFE
jgi:hypothetical protein